MIVIGTLAGNGACPKVAIAPNYGHKSEKMGLMSCSKVAQISRISHVR